jgi:hypothetical protein
MCPDVMTSTVKDVYGINARSVGFQFTHNAWDIFITEKHVLFRNERLRFEILKAVKFTSEMSVYYETTVCHIPEDCHLHTHCHENLISYNAFVQENRQFNVFLECAVFLFTFAPCLQLWPFIKMIKSPSAYFLMCIQSIKL